MTFPGKLSGWFSDPVGMEKLLLKAVDRATRDHAPAPQRTDLTVALAESIMFQGRIAEARTLIGSVLEVDPAHESALWCEAILSFHCEDPLPHPWKKLEARWPLAITGPKPYPDLPPWDGAPLHGRSVLLAAEGGLGDQIQFIRFVPALKAAGAGPVTVSASERLIPLLRSMAADRFVPAGAKIIHDPPDVVVPILSVPGLLNTTWETLPREVPYLHVPASASLRRDRDSAFHVGLCWQSTQATKTLLLKVFTPLAEIPGVRLFGLGERTAIADECAAFPLENRGSEGADILGTAAAIESMDLVISIDTMVAHLAGSLAKPVWTILEPFPDWRWTLRGETTPWYPTMRLFRRNRQDPASVIQKLVKQLSESSSNFGVE